MDEAREAELREQGWIQVGDDLLSPELINLLRARVARSEAEDVSWDEMVTQVEGEEAPGPPDA